MWLASTNEDHYNRYAEELFELASEQLLIIGTVGFAPLPVIVSNQVGRLPARRALDRRRHPVPA